MTPTSGHAYAALLRAVNVGGRGKLPMADLRALVEAAAGTDVQTYIQSGNVVFRHRLASSDRVAAQLEATLYKEAGLHTSVMVRTAGELALILAENPFPARGEHVHVAFLSRSPSPSDVADAGLDRFAPEEAAVVGRQVYLFLPNGVGRAKLPNALSKLAVPATLRNWRTVTTLSDMASRLAAT